MRTEQREFWNAIKDSEVISGGLRGLSAADVERMPDVMEFLESLLDTYFDLVERD